MNCSRRPEVVHPSSPSHKSVAEELHHKFKDCRGKGCTSLSFTFRADGTLVSVCGLKRFFGRLEMASQDCRFVDSAIGEETICRLGIGPILTGPFDRYGRSAGRGITLGAQDIPKHFSPVMFWCFGTLNDHSTPRPFTCHL